ncbi:hypothetical protein DVH05_005383 [Phytophthora capsici]|nr:hypothetical protein DVH05_005383 [Phytophthora capsici]
MEDASVASGDDGLEEDHDDIEDSDESDIEKGDEVRSSEYEKTTPEVEPEIAQKASRKAARTATAVSPRGGDDDDKGFSRRWATWEDFNEAFEPFQAAMFQNFTAGRVHPY